jgi:prephenate dehydrogenase
VLVVGTGLIGTSIGLALRHAGVPVRLYDAQPERARAAAALGAGVVDVTVEQALTPRRTGADDPGQPPVTRLVESAPRAALAVVATPPQTVPGVVVAVQRAGLAEVVTDVASVKLRPLREVLALGGDLATYVGSHPLAGRERSGPQAARGDLFVGVPWVVAAAPEARADAVERVTGLARACGAVPVAMSAADHDAAVAVVSHLPHVMAVLTAARLVDASEAQVGLAGQGLRDVTRVAASDPLLWQQILSDNSGPVLQQLQAVRADLDTLMGALTLLSQGARTDGVVDLLQRGVAGRARVPGKHGGPPARELTVSVVVPDRPGELARILTAAGRAGVNVEDIRIEHSPGQPVGMVELTVRPQAADLLVDTLRAGGWTVPQPPPPFEDPAASQPERQPRDPLVVAIDGPSGSGKSTVAREVARRLGLAYLDTGAMYRALTWWCLHRGIDLGDEQAVAGAARTLPLELGTDPAVDRVMVDGIDVTTEIRRSQVSEQVSRVATNQAVRAELRRRQRQVIERGGVVAEGRDITTVVAPDAPVRILLTADAGTRLARRAQELYGTIDERTLAATREQVVRRDAQDATVAEFTTAAEGVTLLDSSGRTPDQVVDAVLAVVADALPDRDVGRVSDNGRRGDLPSTAH